MARQLPPLLGRANVHRRPDGSLVVDTDSLRKRNAHARTDGYDDDVGDDDDYDDDIEGDDDDYDDDDVMGDDDDYDDDDIEGDDDDYDDEVEGDDGDVTQTAEDDVGRRRRRRRRRRGRGRGRRRRTRARSRGRGRKRRTTQRRPTRRPTRPSGQLRGRKRPTAAQVAEADRKKLLGEYTYPTTVSGRGVSAAIVAPAGVEAELIQITPTVTIRLNDLRMSFDAPAPLVAGSNLQFVVQQIRVGDDLLWNDNVGVDSRLFLGDTTLRHLLAGRMASPAQPVFLSGSYINNGSVATATVATVNCTITAFKKGSHTCPI